MKVTIVVSTPAGDVDLSVGPYELAGGTFESEAMSHRRTEVTNQFVEGTYVVNSLRENVVTPISFYVRSDTHAGMVDALRVATDAFSQSTFEVTISRDSVKETWQCFSSDYTVATQREFQHALMARVDVQVVHTPAAIVPRVSEGLASHVAASDPHPQYLTDTAFDGHLAAPDPHPQYEQVAQKGVAGGYAELDASGAVPREQVPSAAPAVTATALLVPDVSDDFDGDLSGWTNASGNVSVVAGALRVSPASDVASVVATSNTMFPQDRRWAVVRMRLRYNVLPTAGITGDTLTIQNQEGQHHFDLFVNTDGTWRADTQGSTTEVLTGVAVQVGHWYDIEVVVDFGDPGYPVTLRIDNQVFTFAGSGLPASTARAVLIGSWSNNAKTYEFDVDWVTITTSLGDPTLATRGDVAAQGAAARSLPAPDGVTSLVDVDGHDGMHFVTVPAKVWTMFVEALQVGLPEYRGDAPRLSRDADQATGDLGLPGYAGSDTGFRSLSVHGLGIDHVRIRRSGMVVELQVGIDHGWSSPTSIDLPHGFRPHAADQQGAFFDATGSKTGHWHFSAGGATLLVSGTSTVRASIMWTVTSSWPSYLPGTQITAPAQWT